MGFSVTERVALAVALCTLCAFFAGLVIGQGSAQPQRTRIVYASPEGCAATDSLVVGRHVVKYLTCVNPAVMAESR